MGRTFQEAKNASGQVRDTWDTALSNNLREDAIKLKDYTQLSKIKFARVLIPFHSRGGPLASGGSEHAYGAVLYLRWESDQGPVTRLVESKARLTLLDQKGDAVKAEICGAVDGRLASQISQRPCGDSKREHRQVAKEAVMGQGKEARGETRAHDMSSPGPGGAAIATHSYPSPCERQTLQCSSTIDQNSCLDVESSQEVYRLKSSNK